MSFPGYIDSGGAYRIAPGYAGGGLDGSNYLMIAVPYSLFGCGLQQNAGNTNNVDPNVPFYMDSKRDDGIPTSGTIQVVRTAGAPVYGDGSANLVLNAYTCAHNATAYNLTGNYNPRAAGAGNGATVSAVRTPRATSPP